MKHVKSQRVFEGEESDKLKMLKKLNSRGLISPDEYVRDAVELANQEGLDLEEILDPSYLGIFIKPRFEDTAEDVAQDIEFIESWMKSWVGPRGERIVRATGTCDVGEMLDSVLVISNGAVMRFYWELDESDDSHLNSIDVGGQRFELDPKEFWQITHAHMRADWERYMHELLSATVALSY